MSARLLLGGPPARSLLRRLARRARAVARKRGAAPALHAVSLRGGFDDELYVRKLAAAAGEAGIEVEWHRLRTERGSVARRVLERLGRSPRVDGLLLVSPPPGAEGLLDLIPPEKDVEGLTPANYGRLFSAKNLEEAGKGFAFVPATAGALIALLRLTRARVRGAQAVVVGRSAVVGRPTAHLLSAMDATVTLCHSKTRDLGSHLRRADIVVAAAGRAGLIRGACLKRGAVVLDAGVNLRKGRLVGDVEFEEARRRAGWITPVPGGVGPLTQAFLLANVVRAAERT